MAVTSYREALLCADDSLSGSIPWFADWLMGTNLIGDEVDTSDSAYAEVSIAGSQTTHWLKCTDFGFTLSDVPSGATIDGFEIEVTKVAFLSTPTISDTNFGLYKAGSQVGTPGTSAGDWSTVEDTVTYGSSTFLAGTSFNDSEVRSSDFGCGLQIITSASRLGVAQRNKGVNRVRMRVYYSGGGPAPEKVPPTGIRAILAPFCFPNIEYFVPRLESLVNHYRRKLWHNFNSLSNPQPLAA